MTLQQLQNITLQKQGLLENATFGSGKDAVLDALERLGYLQIDTLSIVERAHHHTLWSRIPDYEMTSLYELVKDKKVFEYWFHAASYLPMKDFRFALPQMLDFKQNKSSYYNADPKVMQYVIDTIKAEGPKGARDFESETKKEGSWWNWKPTKLALEKLFMQGDLMICERNGMQKSYDITERVLPTNINLTVPTPLEYATYLVQTYLHAYGFTTIKQVTHLKTGAALKQQVGEVLELMVKAGSLQKISIDGLPTVFVQSEWMDHTFNESDTVVKLLSPFDNSIIHRDRVKSLFDFDFRLECYTPKEKREYGYFCLPILFGTTFIGRMDCKAHRKDKVFEIIHLHIENLDVDFELWRNSFFETVKQFAVFNGCETIKLTKVSPSKFTNKLKKINNLF